MSIRFEKMLEGQSYNIYVDNLDFIDEGELTAECQSFLVSIVNLIFAAKNHASKKLLKTYNSTWAEEGEEIEHQTFCDNLTVSSIRLRGPEEQSSICFSTSGMFDGHSIFVHIA